jgi:hypothetical protein
MLSTFENFYNNVIKTLNESVYSLPTFKNRITIENGEKVIRGSVDFSYQQLTELPDLSDVKVLGGFNCSYNRLQTLKGAPKYVSGNFYCNSNQLQTLEGAPKHIGVFFSCDNNSQLTTLKGLPKYIGGDLCWHDTKVTMEDFYENLLLSDVKGNPMYQDEDEGDHNYPESPMSNEEAYVNAEAYGIYNTPSEYTIDF